MWEVVSTEKKKEKNMEAKISKTVRLSAEVIAMIEAQAGENFTAKFEALVTRCMWELPKKEQELEACKERIQYEKKQLHRLEERIRAISLHISRLERISNAFISTENEINRALNDLRSFHM